MVMGTAAILSLAITCNLGLVTICGIIVNGWVKSSRVDKIQADLDKLWERFTRVEVLESRLDNLDKHVQEIKEMIKELGSRNDH